MSPFTQLDDLDVLRIWDGVSGREVGGERLTMAVVELEPGAVVPEHSHEHEQVGVCVAGSLDFRAGEETRCIGPSGAWRIPGDMPHEVRAGPEGAVVVESWFPRRDDWVALERRGPAAARWPGR